MVRGELHLTLSFSRSTRAIFQIILKVLVYEKSSVQSYTFISPLVSFTPCFMSTFCDCYLFCLGKRERSQQAYNKEGFSCQEVKKVAVDNVAPRRVILSFLSAIRETLLPLSVI